MGEIFWWWMLCFAGWLCLFNIGDISQFINDMEKTWENYEE